MEDSFRHQGLRKQLIEQLEEKGIHNTKVLAAMSKIPRHLFMDNAFLNFAYQDKAFPIGSGQTISQPYTVAFQTQLLDPKLGEKILEVGTGSGYQTAVLYYLKLNIFTIERNHNLFRITSKLFSKINIRPKKFVYGDGYNGLSDNSPFDGIIVTAGCPVIPKKLLSQLKIGGKMIIPVGKETQIMTKITRVGKTEFKKETFGNFKFVPMLEKKN